MTILPHAIWKMLHNERTELARPFELPDLAASKAMQMHADEIEVARRFWACPFENLSIGGERSRNGDASGLESKSGSRS